MIRLVFAVIALLPIAAQAALPPCAMDDIIRKATDVVQVEVREVARPDGIGDPDLQVVCPVEAVVQRVFRGNFSVGQTINFGVLCWS